jgi:hypothetical protein
MIRVLSIWKNERQKSLLTGLLQQTTENSPPLEGWRKFKEFLTGWSKLSALTFFKFRRKNKNEYLCSPNIQKNVFKNNSTQSRK